MRRVGGPEVLEIEEVALRPLGPGEVRLRTLASAINRSDLEIRAGHWPILRSPKFPYVPGLEVVGEVVERAPDVSTLSVGQRAWTAMQGLGGVRAERDGGYAEHVTLAASAAAPLPSDVDPITFAALGLAAVTALEGLRKLGPLRGKTVAVSGVTGGVGAVAVSLVRALGAEVIALERSTPLPPPASVDAVLDTVAGPSFGALVASLKFGGRYSIVGAVGGGEVSFDAWALLEERILTGYSSETLDGETLRRATRELIALELPPPPTTLRPLAEAARAHDELERRLLRGRVVLVP